MRDAGERPNRTILPRAHSVGCEGHDSRNLRSVWGDPHLLFLTVESVRAQSDGDWRMTVLDDCYPSDVVAPWFDAVRDERITYVRNDVNLGDHRELP